MKDYYGLTENFPFQQLVTHSKIQKKLSFVSKGVFNLLKSDCRNQLKIMNVGVKLFSINKKTLDSTGQETCLYRVCQDGLIYIIPFMRKRVFYCGKNLLTKIIKSVDLRHADIEDIELKGILDNLPSGCVVLISLKDYDNNLKVSQGEVQEMTYTNYLEFLKEKYEDSLCCYNSAVRISTMINKEHQHVFNLKYDL